MSLRGSFDFLTLCLLPIVGVACSSGRPSVESPSKGHGVVSESEASESSLEASANSASPRQEPGPEQAPDTLPPGKEEALERTLSQLLVLSGAKLRTPVHALGADTHAAVVEIPAAEGAAERSALLVVYSAQEPTELLAQVELFAWRPGSHYEEPTAFELTSGDYDGDGHRELWVGSEVNTMICAMGWVSYSQVSLYNYGASLLSLSWEAALNYGTYRSGIEATVTTLPKSQERQAMLHVKEVFYEKGDAGRKEERTQDWTFTWQEKSDTFLGSKATSTDEILSSCEE